MEATTNHRLNVALLSAELAYEAWWSTFWAPLSGEQKITRVNGIRQSMPAPNAVVQVVNDFIEEGRDNMLAAMLKPLEEDPVYGDTWLKGTGEDLGLRYTRIYINQVRKAVTKLSGKMSNQRLKRFNLMEKAKPSLVEYWGKWFNAAMFMTLYEGISPQISIGTDDDGVGMKVRYHPNMYYGATGTGDSSTLASFGTEFKTKTQTEWAANDGNIAGDMCSKLIMLMGQKIKTDLLIEPVLTDAGDPFWLWLVHPAQFRNLKTDTRVISMQNSAWTAELRKHPAIRGRDMMYYDGFAILEERTGVRSTTLDDQTLYSALAGTNGWLKPPVSTGTLAYGSIILGRDAIAFGTASNLSFTEEKDDHGNVSEIGSAVINGANRSEYFEDADVDDVYNIGNSSKTVHTTAYTAKNQSSAIVWTK